MEGPYYVVDDDRGDPVLRFIIAQFARLGAAESFCGEVGGQIVPAEEIPELVEAWSSGDVSRWAHYEAGSTLASLYVDLDNMDRVPLDSVIDRYAETDPLCAAVLRVHRLLAEVRATMDEVIPADVEKFFGVGIREPSGPWMSMLERQAAEERDGELVDA